MHKMYADYAWCVYYHFVIICQLTITMFCSYYNSSG